MISCGQSHATKLIARVAVSWNEGGVEENGTRVPDGVVWRSTRVARGGGTFIKMIACSAEIDSETKTPSVVRDGA